MRRLENSEVGLARRYFSQAKIEAEKQTNYLPRTGVLLIKNKKIIGRGFNPHPEKMAINDAIHNYSKEEIEESTLYSTTINRDKSITSVGRPSCKMCGKKILENKVAKVILLHEDGFYEYNAEEYNNLSCV